MADDEEPQAVQIRIDPEQMAGVWANFAQVSHSPYEFTLDFIRLQFGEQPPHQGIVVSRISVSPLFIDELIQALQKNWELYAKKALPQEVYDDGATPDAGDSDGDTSPSGLGNNNDDDS